MPALKKKQLQSLPGFLLVIIFLIGFCTHLLISVIFAESKSDGVIHACANKQNGELRIITNYKDFREGKLEKLRRDSKENKEGCRENESALTWNIQGPPGPSGQGGGASVPIICLECEVKGEMGDRLVGKDLSNAMLTASVFSGANLEYINFSNAILKYVDLENANLSHVNFKDANLTGANLTSAKLDAVTWDNTICPDESNSNDHENTCEGHLAAPNGED